MRSKIPEDVENGKFFTESISRCARAASCPPTDMPFTTPVNPLHASVGPAPIGHPAAELLSSDCPRVKRILTFSRVSLANISMLNQWGNGCFSSACHVPPKRPYDRKLDTALARNVPYRLSKFQPCTVSRLTCARFRLTPLHTVADRQSDRQTDIVPLVIVGQATLSLASPRED